MPFFKLRGWFLFIRMEKKVVLCLYNNNRIGEKRRKDLGQPFGNGGHLWNVFQGSMLLLSAGRNRQQFEIGLSVTPFWKGRGFTRVNEWKAASNWGSWQLHKGPVKRRLPDVTQKHFVKWIFGSQISSIMSLGVYLLTTADKSVKLVTTRFILLGRVVKNIRPLRQFRRQVSNNMATDLHVTSESLSLSLCARMWPKKFLLPSSPLQFCSSNLWPFFRLSTSTTYTAFRSLEMRWNLFKEKGGTLCISWTLNV